MQLATPSAASSRTSSAFAIAAEDQHWQTSVVQLPTRISPRPGVGQPQIDDDQVDLARSARTRASSSAALFTTIAL
jgi:hypothetical protein